jgi:DNA polymerase-3 subunit gamma/tau
VVLGGAPAEVSERAREALEERKNRFAAGDLLRMLQAVGELEPRFRKSGQQQLLVETLLVRFALLDKSVELEDVLRSLSGGSGGGGSSPFARPEPRPTRAEASGTRAEPPRVVAPPPAAAVPAPRVPQAVPRVEQAAVRAESVPRAPQAVSRDVPDINAITGRWDDLVEKLRGEKPMLASALVHSSPLAIDRNGALTIGLDEPNDIFAHSINGGRAEILGALRAWFPALEKVELKRDENAPVAPPKRLTDEMIRAERMASLKKKDPVLAAAIEALDLDVTD